MDDLLLAQVLEREHNLGRDVLGKVCFQAVLPLEEVLQAAPGAVLHEQVELVLVLEGLVEFDYRGVI